MSPHSAAPPHIVLFDGVCHLCASTVQFILQHDPHARFHFAPLQSPIGQQLLQLHQLDPTSLDTFVYITNDQAHTRSTAALLIARHLSFPWPLFYPAIFIPKKLRDPIYRYIAKHRYQWFGKSQSCMMPNPKWKHRFL